MQQNAIEGPVKDARFHTIIERLQAESRIQRERRQRSPDTPPSQDPYDYADHSFSIAPEQGDLIYLLCRGMRATRVAEFATSVGMSTLYFAAAMRDNGGGKVIGSELVPAKVAAAKRNLADAGLAGYADVREGDARQTLRDLGGPVDFILIDGWPVNEAPSLARQVIEILAPQLRSGGYVVNDNAEPDFLDFIRDPANGFLSITLPIHHGTELSVKVA
jgi:predicted O-methyltransferase YrrM